MTDTLAHYTFLPWVRRGIAARIDEADHLGTQPDTGPMGRAGLSVELVVDYVPKGGGSAAALPAVTRRVELIGPGDVLGIKPNTVLRTEPYANAVNVTPGELAFVEFYEEDFPWRYTPARAAKASESVALQHKLRPWLALFVLRSDEFTIVERSGELATLSVNPGVPLPPVDETWVWAHAQVGGDVASIAEVDAAIASAPDRSLSRLMCPRKLVADTSYVGFIVPAFETGRLAGLNEPDPGTPAQKPSWSATAADRRFPIYFQWAFKTSSSGGFETLARKLVASPVGPNFGKRTMDISDAGYGLPVIPGATIQLEGALCPPDFDRIAFPQAPSANFAAKLRALVDLSEDMQLANAADLPHPLASTANRPSAYAPMLRPSVNPEIPDDPILTPPAYGRMHANVGRIADAAANADLDWLCELNLDPRCRVAAGLGTEVVRQFQDEFMERAWKQVGEIEATNQRMREAELAAAAGDALHAKHLSTMPDDRLLTLTAAAQRGLRAPAVGSSVRGLIADSRVPTAAQSATFKRLSRPQRKLMRQLTGSGQVEGVQDVILAKMNRSAHDALSTARPKEEPPAAVALPMVSAAMANALGAAIARPEAKSWFIELLRPILIAQLPNLDTVGVATIQVSASAELKRATGTTPEEIALASRVQALIDAILAVSADGVAGAKVMISSPAFKAEYGDIGGKTYAGVTVTSYGVATDAVVARSVGVNDLKAYKVALGQFSSTFVTARPLPAPAAALPAISSLASHVLERLRPQFSIACSVTAGIEGLEMTLSSRDSPAARPLSPIMASPVFNDPMFEPLRRLSQDYILPNVSDLPKDSLTLMEPNTRFIEAYMAGLNVEMSRELLWREYPTDQRGTPMRTFWDTRDAIGHPVRQDIKPIHLWMGKLGSQSQMPPQTLVLVIRGELFQKYPNTILYAQEAAWIDNDPRKPRMLKTGGVIIFPAFHAALEPDIAVFGFDLSEAVARGHRRVDSNDTVPDQPGWFFVLKERPGQVRFGADESTPATGFATWDDLAWDRIPLADGLYVRIGGAGVAPPQPNDPAGVAWGASAAHQAFAMFQNPVIFARHAAEMLPPE